MKYLKKFNESVSESEISKICQEFGIRNWSLNSDGLVDIDGSVNLNRRKLEKLPLKFGTVSGDFWCSNNKLTTLEGAPGVVRGYFDCGYNKLGTLEGAPREVRGYFSCRDNKLTTLEGAPGEVGGYFDCRNNKLGTLEGAPRIVRGHFWCIGNQIHSFEGSPRHVRGGFLCTGNPIEEVWNLFRDFRHVDFLNDCDPLRLVDGKPTVILDRLNYFLEEIGKKPVEKLEGLINI